MDSRKFESVHQELLRLQSAGRIAELSRKIDIFEIRVVGASSRVDSLQRQHPEIIKLRTPNQQAYYFLSDELRPGSGIIRNSGGRSEGPGGTLTCLLSSIDGRHNYFVSAGHVLSNFWTKKEKPDKEDELKKDPVASIYRYRRGFPATNSTRFLGKLHYLSKKPRLVNAMPGDGGCEVFMDIGIVKILFPEEDATLKQRTTSYGSFGEWPCENDMKIKKGQRVMKCGAEETHWTYAVVEDPCCPVTVYGPDGLLYELSDQVILSSTVSYEPLYSTDPPLDWSTEKSKPYKAPFAVPGDSGTMVVDQESRRPLGMLIAGSILDGRYVMTPIKPIHKFWTEKDLILLRA
jgi:hypothetical protein